VIKYYCDNCGKELTRENVVDLELKTFLIYDCSIKDEPVRANIDGHLCMECAETYKKEINQIIGGFTTSKRNKFIELA
jgi:hypothetical protein